jgi:hypothetical protein
MSLPFEKWFIFCLKVHRIMIRSHIFLFRPLPVYVYKSAYRLKFPSTNGLFSCLKSPTPDYTIRLFLSLFPLFLLVQTLISFTSGLVFTIKFHHIMINFRFYFHWAHKLCYSAYRHIPHPVNYFGYPL